MVRALLALGDVDVMQSQYHSASRLYDRALHLAARLGFRKGGASALRSLGTMAARKRQLVLAARYYGACGAMLEAINGKLAAFQSIGYDAALSSVRSELGETDFQRSWREGGSLPIDSLQTEIARINGDDAAQ